jgi:hypothetical protein
MYYFCLAEKCTCKEDCLKTRECSCDTIYLVSFFLAKSIFDQLGQERMQIVNVQQEHVHEHKFYLKKRYISLVLIFLHCE